MSDPPSWFLLERVDYAPAGDRLALLHVRGSWRARPSGAVRLEVVADGRRHRFPALSAPAAGTSWRASFEVERDLVERAGAALILHAGRQTAVLPAPALGAPGAGAQQPGYDHEVELAVLHDRVNRAAQRRGELERALRDALAWRDTAVAAALTARVAAQARNEADQALTSVRAELDQVRAQAEQAAAARTAREAAEARAREAVEAAGRERAAFEERVDELIQASAALEQAQESAQRAAAEADRLSEQHRDADAEHEARLEEQADALEAARRDLADAATRLSSTEERLAETESALAVAQAETVVQRAERERLQDELASAEAERRRSAESAGALVTSVQEIESRIAGLASALAGDEGSIAPAADSPEHAPPPAMPAGPAQIVPPAAGIELTVARLEELRARLAAAALPE